MVLLYLSAFLCHIVALSCMSSAERHLVCSSESVSLWYSYDGPLYLLSLTGSPCSVGMTLYSLTYTVIPMFSTTCMGCHALLHYEGQLWFDHVQPEVSCEHLKICDIIKGASQLVHIHSDRVFPLVLLMKETDMVLLYSSTFLWFIALSCMSSVRAERRLLCSSEHLSVWYTFDGPLYYLSMTASPCSLGVNLFSVTYTVIPMFTISHVGFHGSVHYKGQLWLDHIQPSVPCEDFKICYITKGETLHETFPVYMKKFNGPEGEYQIYLTVDIIDDLGNKVTLQSNATIEAKNYSSEKTFFVPQLGGL